MNYIERDLLEKLMILQLVKKFVTLMVPKGTQELFT
jgi:hypothetical protein